MQALLERAIRPSQVGSPDDGRQGAVVIQSQDEAGCSGSGPAPEEAGQGGGTGTHAGLTAWLRLAWRICRAHWWTSFSRT